MIWQSLTPSLTDKCLHYYLQFYVALLMLVDVQATPRGEKISTERHHATEVKVCWRALTFSKRGSDFIERKGSDQYSTCNKCHQWRSVQVLKFYWSNTLLHFFSISRPLKSKFVDWHFGIRKAVEFLSKTGCHLLKLVHGLTFYWRNPFCTSWHLVSPRIELIILQLILTLWPV